MRFYELTDRNAGSQNRARNSRVSFWFSAARTPLFRRIADVKYDRAASKRRFHCSDSIDIERSFLPLFSRFPTGFLFFTRAAPLDCFPCLFLPLRPSPPRSRVFSSSVILSPFLPPPLYSIFHSLSLFLIISRQASADTRALTRSYERRKSVGSVAACPIFVTHAFFFISYPRSSPFSCRFAPLGGSRCILSRAVLPSYVFLSVCCPCSVPPLQLSFLSSSS